MAMRGPWRDAIQADLAEGLALAGALRAETPLMRYLIRVLTGIDPANDVLVVLRHPEDAQQASDHLLDFLTAPGSFVAGVPELRVTTPGHYASEVQRKKPTVVIWAASTDVGARSYIGDAYCPSQFRLVVAGHDALTLSRVLDAAVADEYALYAERVGLLRKALPWVAKEYGGFVGGPWPRLGQVPDRIAVRGAWLPCFGRLRENSSRAGIAVLRARSCLAPIGT